MDKSGPREVALLAGLTSLAAHFALFLFMPGISHRRPECQVALALSLNPPVKYEATVEKPEPLGQDRHTDGVPTISGEHRSPAATPPSRLFQPAQGRSTLPPSAMSRPLIQTETKEEVLEKSPEPLPHAQPVEAIQSSPAGESASSGESAIGTSMVQDLSEAARLEKALQEMDVAPKAKPKPSPVVKPNLEEKEISTDYVAVIRRAIVSQKRYPEHAKLLGQTGKVRVALVVASDGSLESAELLESSGIAALDDAALNAVESASPFARFPVGLDRPQLRFTITLSFRLE